jgi:multiple sugar transport system ATP-binding protein
MTKAEKTARIAETAAVLGLTDLLDRRPAALSGGQRQRVAIGRAMVRDPVAFLFDEPLSNLDAQLRAQMRIELKRLHQRLGTTIVYVTHDQVEAMTMADRIVVMRDGDILQVGTPVELYESPADLFTARFIGSPSMNILEGRVAGGRLTFAGALAGLDVGAMGVADGAVKVGVRPHDLIVGARDAGGAQPPEGTAVGGTVSAVEPLGAETLVHLEAGGEPIIATAPGRLVPQVGGQIMATAARGSLYLFDAATGRALGRA